jgi:trypsin-like peptidase/IPT/TIG domain-containing protein
MPRAQLEQLSLALVIGLIMVSLALLAPAAVQWLGRPAPTPAPNPTPSASPPPAAVLLPAELDQALEGVVTIVNDRTFGTAFVIDTRGDLLTAASLIQDSTHLRLVDNTGGSHPVRVIGIDPAIGVAQIRAENGGVPMPFGDPESLESEDPVVLLASPKVATLPPSTPAVVSHVSPSRLGLRVNDRPGNLGGPVVAPGGKVVGIFLGTGTALPISTTQADLAQWGGRPGTLLPLADLPSALVLRGADTTSAPSNGPRLQAITPTRASAAQDAMITIQGSGFTSGPWLRVRFVPVASPSGAFDGLAPTLVSASTLTVKVPAGRVVQDYVVQLTNGDGMLASSRTAFTITP